MLAPYPLEKEKKTENKEGKRNLNKKTGQELKQYAAE